MHQVVDPALPLGLDSAEGGISVLRRKPAFTLIELLVVVAIIGLLISLVLPSLSAARQQARAAKCLSNLRVLGQGLAIYATQHRDALVPGRLPRVDDCNTYATIRGGRKFRPTFTAMMSRAVGAPPFSDPQACRTDIDLYNEAGDRQNYDYDVYVCPSVAEWTDERNGAYGYNYQFLGNSRLLVDGVLDSYKNWSVRLTQIRYPAETVAAGDCMGTAASWPTAARLPYENNARDAERFGNEGFNLDPPRIDPARGEAANIDSSPQSRTAVDPRHQGRGSVLWLDGHCGSSTLAQLGYQVGDDGVVGFDGENILWTGDRRDVPWTPEYRP